MLTVKHQAEMYKLLRQNINRISESIEENQKISHLLAFEYSNGVLKGVEANLEDEFREWFDIEISKISKALDKSILGIKKILKNALREQKKCLEIAYIKKDAKTASGVIKEIERIQLSLDNLNGKTIDEKTRNRKILDAIIEAENMIPQDYLEGL